MTLPSIAIAIIIILVIISFSTAIYFIFQKVKGRGFHGGRGASSVRGDSKSNIQQSLQHEEEEEYISEKKDNTISPYAAVVVGPLMQYNTNLVDNGSTLNGSENSSTSSIPTIPIVSSSFEKTPVYERQQQEDNGSSVWTSTSDTESTTLVLPPLSPPPPPPPPPPALADFKISLPLPPPSSSFFSDKMELDSIEANDLYACYMTAAKQQDFVSIDLDEKPFLSNAAANISQKAATLRSTLRQSMRRKSSSGLPKVALNHLFDNVSSTSSVNKMPSSPRLEESIKMSRNSSSTSSRYPNHGNQSRSSLQLPPTIPPSPRPDSPATAAADFFGKFSNNSNKKSLVATAAATTATAEEEETHSNKIMIDDDLLPPELSYFSLPMSSPSTTNTTTTTPLVMKTTIQEMQQQKQDMLQQQEEYASIIQEIDTSQIAQQEAEVIASSDEEGPDKEEGEQQQQDVALTARRLIRTASRKSRTRSTIMTDEAAQATFTMISQTSNKSATKLPTPSIVTSTAAAKYATLRKHNMEIDTTLKRQQLVDIQKWTPAESPLSATASSPSPKRAIMSSITLNGSNTVSGGKKVAAKQQLKNMLGTSSNNLFKGDEKSMTLGRSSTAVVGGAEGGPKSLRNLFTSPSMDESPVTATPLNFDKDDENDMGSNKSMVESEPDDNTHHDDEEEEEDKLHSAITDDISVLTNTTPNPPAITPLSKHQQQTPYFSSASKNTTTNNNNNNNGTFKKMGNNVDTIRRMLQSSWSGNNLKESDSSTSLSSSYSSVDYMGSVGSSFKPVVSPLGSINPRLQNQHLVSLSLKASKSQQTAARSRPSMPVGFMINEEGEGGPVPTASFSSSTVRTMIPAEEEEEAALAAAESKKKGSSLIRNILDGSGSIRQTRQQTSRLNDSRKVAPMNNSYKKQATSAANNGKKTPAQIEREKYLKSLQT